MRILIINTSEKTGGAAVASNRLLSALNNNGVKAKMLVRNKETENLSVVSLPHSLKQKWNFLWERFCIFLHLHLSKKGLFDIDIANTGCDITRTKEFLEADIIHLEWINQGMLSLKNIRKIIESGKPVVWTMHDLWPATALCHYARGCIAFKTSCKRCPLLPHHGSLNDLSARIWAQKQKTYSKGRIHFVCCSNWLAQQAKQSGLLKGHSITSIPNPIDTHVFHPINKNEARESLSLPKDKHILLFVSQKVTNERKGVHHLIDAIKELTALHPQLKDTLAVALMGGSADEVASQLPVETFSLGYISDDKTLVNAYNAADLFVIPSLEDNLPNTIMEALACGIPCVGFNIGGIPEMIDHEVNGYIALPKSAKSLAQGIHWVLSHPNKGELAHQAVAKVNQNYSQQGVAMRYINLYNEALARKIYKL